MTTTKSPSKRIPNRARSNPTGPARLRVAVAMSGGVDSSVVAALMARAGHDLFGVTLQLYDQSEATGRPGACCAGRDIRDARRVAEHLGIPHYVLDYESRFREAVIDDFADSYLKGQTPLPCVRCNQRVKFRDLLQTARELGADFLATGHYARRIERDGRIELHRAADGRRDQSYFLFATTPDQLSTLRFPLGEYESKEQVREIAVHSGLPVANKPDSQDLCFVAGGKYADTLARLRPEAMEKGRILHESGEILGEHDGIGRFTVGQHRGLGIGGSEPLFVLRIDPASRDILVGSEQSLYRKELRLSDVNWLATDLAGAATESGWPVSARIRSGAPLQDARIFPEPGHSASVRFCDPVRAITPGQACVFYGREGSRLLGGGWIRPPEAAEDRAPFGSDRDHWEPADSRHPPLRL